MYNTSYLTAVAVGQSQPLYPLFLYYPRSQFAQTKTEDTGARGPTLEEGYRRRCVCVQVPVCCVERLLC